VLVRKCYRYRLYPTNSQAAHLHWVLDRCRELYNAALHERREAYRMAGVKISYYAQRRELPGLKEDCPEFTHVGSQVLQDVLKRVDLAFAAFFRRVRAGEKPGYPRFKGYDRYDSCTYSQAGWKLEDGRLVLAGIGALKIKWSRPIQGTIKTVTIHRSADQWHVCFSCVLDVPQPAVPARPATALDVGLEYFATLADGSHIDNPRYFREAEAVVARRQRRRDRKKRGSKNRRRATLLVAKAHRRIHNKRLDFHHQEARKIVDRHGALAVEGLRIKNMVRNPCLAKSISDAGWNQFLTILTAKAAEAGLVVVVVNPAGTSQVCSGCGRTVPKTLSDRWHICPYEDCGLSLQRDHNSAREILNRAGLSDPLRGYPVAVAPAVESQVL
jgi:putative transposase